MQEPFDRAAMIEAASRSLRQQMVRNGARDSTPKDCPRSKGSLHPDQGGSGGPPKGPAHAGGGSGLLPGSPGAGAAEAQKGESAQRRIRSAENQSRLVRTTEAPSGLLSGPDGLPQGTLGALPAGAIAASAGFGGAIGGVVSSGGGTPGEEDPFGADGVDVTLADGSLPQGLESFNGDDELDEDMQLASHGGLEDAFQNFRQEMKRPLSRKKDPSASAAAGLGALSGPARVTDAFEQRKTRQPIPVESWGPRPPSRAGVPGKTSPLDGGVDVDGATLGRPSSCLMDPKILLGQSRAGGASAAGGRSAGTPQQAPLGAKGNGGASASGGTWAAARAEPRGHSESRGRQRRTGTRSSGSEANFAADLGIFGSGAGVPSQRMTKSLSGVFDNHPAQLGSRGSPWQVHASQMGSWASHVDAAAASALEVSGMGMMGDAAGHQWPGSPSESCGSPPTRQAKMRQQDGVSVEDVEPDADAALAFGLGGGGSSYRRDATPAQVIVTRSSSTSKSRSGNVRRSSGEQRAAREREQNMPFNTSLDVDFLSLFAS
mmetsp:Transcript_16598/g.58127  ORF Transcript_16598/g.58127 Transcript_16598/m.58127 type:complete len:545 (-) Transcript_16598:65-1699(-)